MNDSNPMNESDTPVKPAILQAIDRLAADTAEVVEFLTARSYALENWAPADTGLYLYLVQLFPIQDDGNNATSAAIASFALGGNWTPLAPDEQNTRERWRGEVTMPSGRVQRFYLHSVGPYQPVEAQANGSEVAK